MAAHDGACECEDCVPTKRDDLLKLRRWRQEQFAELGYDHQSADILASSTADLGLARTLIGQQHCSLKLAIRILL